MSDELDKLELHERLDKLSEQIKAMQESLARIEKDLGIDPGQRDESTT